MQKKKKCFICFNAPMADVVPPMGKSVPTFPISTAPPLLRQYPAHIMPATEIHSTQAINDKESLSKVA